ncbi:MAG: hypothetical protein P8J55_10350 [Pseudomonadales bacterium]|nr:hypothetical protein [Pseudomonadales bacterium]
MDYEFGFMDKREKRKILLLKILSVVWMAYMVWETIYAEKLSDQLSAAGGIMVGAYAYSNLYNVKPELMELFEPPYPTRGGGFVIICMLCFIAQIYYQLNWQ